VAHPSDVEQPVVSSLHAIWRPVQLPWRTYRTVSKLGFGLHVSIRAVPETAGVHSKTRSGALAAALTHPPSALAPDVTPANVPPCGGMEVAAGHALEGSVVVVVDVVVTPDGGSVTGTVVTLLPSFSSAIRLNGSSVSRRL
jgi:hypothetical protein